MKLIDHLRIEAVKEISSREEYDHIKGYEAFGAISVGAQEGFIAGFKAARELAYHATFRVLDADADLEFDLLAKTLEELGEEEVK